MLCVGENYVRLTQLEEVPGPGQVVLYNDTFLRNQDLNVLFEPKKLITKTNFGLEIQLFI